MTLVLIPVVSFGGFMQDLLRFDDISITLFIPRDKEDSVAAAARAALDDASFHDGFTNAVRQFIAAIPALSVLSITVEL